MQDYCFGLIYRKKKRDHITPLFTELHWLPVKQRIKFKILLLTFSCILGTAPSYLQNLITIYKPSRTLRSSSKSRLLRPQFNTRFYGFRSFQAAAAELWNNLPDVVREAGTVENFRSLLKTHLFVE